MAYTINGKVYTDHPLMDEMIYNLDTILKLIEIKHEEMAEKYETADTMASSDIFMAIKGETTSFDMFPFTRKMLEDFGYTKQQSFNYAVDRYMIPKEDREKVFEFSCNAYLNEYVEKNNYYRSLIGLPWISEYESEDHYYVYIDESYISEPTLIDVFDFNIPLHEYTNYQIAVLVALGAMDRIYDEYSGKYYKYLHFLGDAKRDLYTVRSAKKWDILYMPGVEILVNDRFRQLYQVNKTVFLQRYYTDAYKYQSDYYEEFMIILLLCQTYTDMIVDIPEWYVRRDVFDLRSCKYFLDSHGIEFFKIIPLKYQIRIVKNMNKLIRYKSTDLNFEDIISLFTVDDVTVYRHYIFKKRIVDIQGSYATGLNPADEYLLEFVKAPVGDTYDNTIKDNIYREPYDDITYADKYWDGQDTHDLIKDRHLSKEFTIEGTKYYSLEDRISISKYAFQIQYFLGMLLDSDMEINDIKINIPTISPVISFSLTDLFILLYCLTANYDDFNLLIRTPEDRTYLDKPEFTKYDDIDGGGPTSEGAVDIYGGEVDVQNKFRMPINGGEGPEYTEITQESFYDWLRWKYPYLWTNMSKRIYGFNMKADLNELAELIGFRHSSFRWHRGYTLEELGVDGFISNTKYDNIDDLVKTYQNNAEIHDTLTEKIINAQTRDDKIIYQFVFDYLFTRNFDYKRYTLASTGELADSYEDILKERNFILWKYFKNVTNESDQETRQDMIRQSMNDIINTLEYYLNYDFLNYIFSVFTITSFNSILKYIYLMINFFKSFKVYFLDPHVTYVMDNKMENTVFEFDQLEEVKVNLWKRDKFFQSDSVGVQIKFIFNELSASASKEVLEVFGHYEPDPTLDLDANGGNINEDNWNFIDLDGAGVEEHENTLDINGSCPNRKYFEEHHPFEYWYDLDGGNPDTEIPLDNHSEVPIKREFDDVCGGGVTIGSYSPYHVYNGGRVGAGLAMFDADGSNVPERTSYINIDGKSAIPEKDPDLLVDFGYDIDGGHPDFNTYVQPGITVRVEDNQIKADVKILPKYRGKKNDLQELDDGLYVEDKFIGYGDYYDLDRDVEELIDNYRQFFNESMNKIYYATHEDVVKASVFDITANYLGPIIEKYNSVSDEIFFTKARINEYTDQKVEELDELVHQWNSVINLGGWDQF